MRQPHAWWHSQHGDGLCLATGGVAIAAKEATAAAVSQICPDTERDTGQCVTGVPGRRGRRRR